MSDKNISDSWERGNPYERYVGRWSRQVAPLFLAWLNIPAGRRWLDVGCGTGALCSAILDRCAPELVSAVEPSEGFLKTAAENLSGKATLYQGTAAKIPLKDASVDVVVSALAFNFMEDQRAALQEMARVTRHGGTIAAYVWDYAGKMEFMRYFWDAAVGLDPQAAKLDEGVRFPVCNPEALEKLFNSAGLKDVETAAIDIETSFENFDEYWGPFLGGQGPAPAYVMSLDEQARIRLRDTLRERLPKASNGSITMIARTWAVRGQVQQ